MSRRSKSPTRIGDGHRFDDKDMRQRMTPPSDVLDLIATMKQKGEPFALATVVRTVAATAAKAGAKAVILPDGSISEGWIGGGCARAAVLKAALEALADGQSRLVSVQPPDVLQEQGLAAGDEKAGVRFAKNMCPSQGTMDVFVEPVLPKPQLVVCGATPVAAAIARLAGSTDLAVQACPDAAALAAWIDTEAKREARRPCRFVIVATQGRGDEAALQAALALEADHVGFVGSRKKAAALKDALAARGVAPERLARLKSPAGLDLGAITPDEIALAILAEIVMVRRQGQPRV
jgi:xanthine dehydrogenase accessory factor